MGKYDPYDQRGESSNDCGSLNPGFQGRLDLVDQVVDAAPEIISHNMETVRRISPQVRSAAKYDVSLSVLRRIAERGVVAKTGSHDRTGRDRG